VQFTAIDMSGQGKYRNLWEKYYEECEGVIFVLDCTDRLRFAVAKDELDIMLENEGFTRNSSAPILFFANKMDCPGAEPPLECMKALELERIQDKSWNIVASDALHGQGVEQGMKWLVETSAKLKGANMAA
jgi:ADP-ribosylation factor-like protein 6